MPRVPSRKLNRLPCDCVSYPRDWPYGPRGTNAFESHAAKSASTESPPHWSCCQLLRKKTRAIARSLRPCLRVRHSVKPQTFSNNQRILLAGSPKLLSSLPGSMPPSEHYPDDPSSSFIPSQGQAQSDCSRIPGDDTIARALCLASGGTDLRWVCRLAQRL